MRGYAYVNEVIAENVDILCYSSDYITYIPFVSM